MSKVTVTINLTDLEHIIVRKSSTATGQFIVYSKDMMIFVTPVVLEEIHKRIVKIQQKGDG